MSFDFKLKNHKFSSNTLAVLVFSLSFLLVYWLLIIPEMQAFKDEEAQISGVLNVKPGKKNSLSSSQGQAIAKTKEQAETLLPLEDNQYDLSVQVEGLCRSMGVVLDSLNITSAAAASTTSKTAAVASQAGMNRTPFSLSVSGQYEDIQRLVRGLATINRLVQIDQVNITSVTAAAGVATGSGTLSAQITASAFYIPSTLPSN